MSCIAGNVAGMKETPSELSSGAAERDGAAMTTGAGAFSEQQACGSGSDDTAAPLLLCCLALSW